MSRASNVEAVTFVRPDGALHGICNSAHPEFLLLHAGEEHAGVFMPVMSRLLDAGFGSLAIDQRGHGKSRELENIPLTRLSDDAAAILETLERPIAVGASLGGFVLMLALAKREVRDRAAAMVLLDVIPDPDPEPVRAFLARALRNGIQNPLVEHILSISDELKSCCRQIDIPVLLLRAGYGTTLTDERAEAFQALVPQAEVITIPTAAHLVAQTAPEELATNLIAFAQKLRG